MAWEDRKKSASGKAGGENRRFSGKKGFGNKSGRSSGARDGERRQSHGNSGGFGRGRDGGSRGDADHGKGSKQNGFRGKPGAGSNRENAGGARDGGYRGKGDGGYRGKGASGNRDPKGSRDRKDYRDSKGNRGPKGNRDYSAKRSFDRKPGRDDRRSGKRTYDNDRSDKATPRGDERARSEKYIEIESPKTTMAGSPAGAVEAETLAAATGEAQPERRKWEPNRAPRKVKSKKSFDQKKVEDLVEGSKSIYRGELDPRQKDPNRKPRSISRSEQKVMEKAEALAEAEAATSNKLGKLASHTDFRDLFETNDASPGRLAALYVTQQVRYRKAYAQEVIEASIDTAKISDVDRSFATLLTLGVVSTQGALDNVLNRALATPRDIQPDVRDAMRISTYEIIYLRKAPHAALDQGVELVRAIAPSASGLANAVLHRVLAMADEFPFGDPNKDLDALALLYAFPKWLAKLLVTDMGAQAAAAFMKASNDPAPLYISVNSLQTSDDEVVGLLEEVGTEVEPVEAGGIAPRGCYKVLNARVLADGRVRRLFSQGKILVSDAAAQAVAQSVLEDGMPETMLEVGAGRGTKTLLIQNIANRLYGDQVELTSMDSHGFKTDLLRERAQDYGVRINDIVTGNGARLDTVMGDRVFSEIFIDAPCSGLGTLRRHQDIRWRLSENQISELSDVGLSLLKSAAGHVELGGHIVYSTCTVTYDENNGVVKRFLESREGEGFALAPINGKSCFTSQLTPGSPDAHFAAKFVRKA